jgi:exosome complex component RRP40
LISLPFSLWRLRRLLDPHAPVLDVLGSALAFELAVGLNGAIWVRAESAATTALVTNALRNAEFLTRDETAAATRRLLRQAAAPRRGA